MISNRPTCRIPPHWRIVCGLVLVGTVTGCQVPPAGVSDAGNRRQWLLGWSPLWSRKAEQTQSEEIRQASFSQRGPLTAADDDVTLGSQDGRYFRPAAGSPDERDSHGSFLRGNFSKWLGKMPRRPRIPLPRTDLGGSDVMVVEPDASARSAGGP